MTPDTSTTQVQQSKRKRSNKKLPCTTCVVFAMCQARKRLSCTILYPYLYAKTSRSTLRYRLKVLQSAFGKIVGDHYATDVKGNIAMGIEWTTSQRIEEETMMKVFGFS